MKNLEIIRGREVTASEVSKCLREYFYYISLLFFESFAFQKTDEEWLKHNVIFEQSFITNILNLYNKGEKIIISSIHIGNWEIVHHYLTDVLGLKVALIYRKQNNEYFEQIISNARYNAKTIDKANKNTLKKVVQSLASGTIIMVLLDQRDIASGEAIQVCGHNAMIPTALVKYAMKAKCHIFAGISYHTGSALNVTIQNEFHTYNDDDTATKITQQIFDGFSVAIKKYPEQWYCLMHDLWRK